MKQKDIAVIIIVVAFSGVVSFFIASSIFIKPQDKKVKAEYVSPITTGFNTPSNKYFNENSLNPTKQIEIGDSANNTPYRGQ